MFIKQIQLSNFQVIREFSANFEGNVYFIKGDNELGKSTLLKAIGVLLTGERDEVLTNGQKKGFAKMVIGDDGENYEVELRFTEKNPRGTISIKSQKTGMQSDNISMLNKIFGYQDFDAVEFSRWSETAEGRRKQVKVVKSLLPKNVQDRIDAIDADVAKIKETRKGDNSEYKTYSSILENASKEITTADLKTYAKPVDMSDLMEEQKTEAQLMEKAKTVRERRELRIKQLEDIPGRIESVEESYTINSNVIDHEEKNARDEYERIIMEAKERLDAQVKSCREKRLKEIELKKSTLSAIKSEQKEIQTKLKAADEWLKEYKANNPEGTDVETRVKNAENHNRMHTKVKDYLSKKEALVEVENRITKHENKLTALLDERETLISKSKLPIEGLTFTEDGLELNNVPFVEGKVSDSQIMEVAAKLIIASNPTVKVFRIARGESLGKNRLQSLVELAQKEGYQGFIEEVVRGQNDMVVEEYKEK